MQKNELERMYTNKYVVNGTDKKGSNWNKVIIYLKKQSAGCQKKESMQKLALKLESA